MNNTKSTMIDMKPKDAIKLDTVKLDKSYPEESVLPEDGWFIQISISTCQTTWRPKNRYRLDRIVQEPGNRILYYLQDEPDRAFVSEELMHISEDTQVPPEWVSKWT